VDICNLLEKDPRVAEIIRTESIGIWVPVE